MDLTRYKELFIEQAQNHLEEMGSALVALERDPAGEGANDAVAVLFRMVHSIKGMAASLGFDAISAFAHRVEDWLDPVRDGAPLDSSKLDLLDDAIGEFERMLAGVSRDGSPPPPGDGWEARLARQPGPTESAEPAPVRNVIESGAPPIPASVSVAAEKLDRFLASVGELIQHEARIEVLHRASPVWDGHRELGDELERMAHTVRELRRRCLEVRTTPLRGRLGRLPRVAARLARDLGKQLELEISGAEVEADRSLLDAIEEPLLHLLRNAIDHGIETPAEREAQGKDPTGRIWLRAARAGSRLHLTLEDDGRGIDVDAIRARAIERGLLPREVAEDLPPARVFDLVFEAGLSSRERPGAVSGRGVGRDAVRRAIEAQRGTVAVLSRAGRGTRCEIDLPLMVALQRVLVLEIGGEAVALPSASVESVLAVREGSLERSGDEAFFVFKQESTPVIDLGPRVGLGAPAEEGDAALVFLESRGLRVGLRVDAVVSDREVFVRRVPAVLEPIGLLAGVAIPPSGIPVFLLDPGALIGEPS